MYSWIVIKPGFHMIARIASDARIAENFDLQSLRCNGNYFKIPVQSLYFLRFMRRNLRIIRYPCDHTETRLNRSYATQLIAVGKGL